MPCDPEEGILGQAPRGMGITEIPGPFGNLVPKRTSALHPEWSPEVASLREHVPAGPTERGGMGKGAHRWD